MRREPILPPGMDAMLRVFCQHGLVRDCPLTSFARNAFLLKPDGSAMRMLFLSASSSSVPASFARLRAAQPLSQPARLLACVMMETAADLSGVSMAHRTDWSLRAGLMAHASRSGTRAAAVPKGHSPGFAGRTCRRGCSWPGGTEGKASAARRSAPLPRTGPPCRQSSYGRPPGWHEARLPARMPDSS